MSNNWKAEWEQIRASPRLTLKNFLPMLFVKFGSRDLLWATLLIAVLFGWWANTRDLRRDYYACLDANHRLFDMLHKYGFVMEEGGRHDTQWRFTVPKNLRDELGPVIVSNP